jgi:uncharacterized protein YndB with AHSA1/START domain
MDNIDPLAIAGLVTREVRTAERGGTPTKVVTARRNYATDQADLWDCLTNPERIPRWFSPVSGNLQLGGKYQIEGNAGGVIEACVEPETFSLTWVYGGGTSWVTVNLSPDADGTTLELIHEAPIWKAFWDQYGPGATGVGWALALLALHQHIATGQSWGTNNETTFLVSPEGQQFLEATAAGWGAAAVADGDDPDAAKAAADACVVFYTPVPDDQ